MASLVVWTGYLEKKRNYVLLYTSFVYQAFGNIEHGNVPCVCLHERVMNFRSVYFKRMEEANVQLRVELHERDVEEGKLAAA